MEKLLKKVDINKEITIGSWVTFSDPAIVEIMASAGFDWLVIDMEHSGLSTKNAIDLIRIIELKGVTPLVRVSKNSSTEIKKFMDMGHQEEAQ